MKTKTIFKMLAAAMLMPTMLLTTACSSDDNEIVNTENPTNTKGYALPVTVNVTRQGEDATTRATYNDNGDGTGSLAFSAGDKLFVIGDHNEAGQFAGTLDYDAVSGKFSGTVYTQNSYEGTADELFTDANDVSGILLPADYGSYGAFSIVGSGYEANVDFDFKKAFAPTKAAAVEQFNLESTDSYSSGFALAPFYAIASFTISGLTANKKVEVSFDTNGAGVISGNVTTSAEGVATFALGVFPDSNLKDCTLTVDGNNIALPTKEVVAGKIYNISRNVYPVALSAVTADYTAQDGDVLTGTLGSNVKISIAAGATVTLKDVNINGSDKWTWGEYAGITCLGNATITLEGTNTVKGFAGDNPGIYVPEDNTLIIKGSGSLEATGRGDGAGIGGGYDGNCGNITISGGDVTAVSGVGGNAAGIGTGLDGTCGDITINGGTVTATGGKWAAGIGCGCRDSTCGDIHISGGTVTAKGGSDAAGIGGGYADTMSTNSCGTITITSGVTHVTATKGKSNEANSTGPESIGAGGHFNGDGWDEDWEEWEKDPGESTCVDVTIEDESKVTQK